MKIIITDEPCDWVIKDGVKTNCYKFISIEMILAEMNLIRNIEYHLEEIDRILKENVASEKQTNS